ncbi:MAG: cytochrome B6, partial [Solirubrobacterales bacterium]|nr:cytochrome B6 [Solirubrobacterales bacterium]
MPKLKLPKPPLPDALVPRPKRPGTTEKTGPLEVAKESGASAIDWVDERTSLSGAARWMMFRKVPKG